MSTALRPVIVKVPFCQGQHRFKILKGQNWGAVDHLLLQEVVQQPCSAQQLADQSNLPRRLIIEIMIPFMRVGWVQLVKNDQGYFFQATDRGLVVASSDELPIEKDPILSFRQFIIDPVTGQCYRVGSRQQSFQIYSDFKIAEILRNKASITSELIIRNARTQPDLIDVLECVAEDDEEVIGYEEHALERPYSSNIRYAIAVVDEHDYISGVPDISPELRAQIIESARKMSEHIDMRNLQSSIESPDTLPFKSFEGASIDHLYVEHRIAVDQYQLVLGPEEHEAHLIKMISNAKNRLIIHSTFINPTNLEKLIPNLMDAARRYVQIDILWGHVEPDEAVKIQQYEETLKYLNGLNRRIQNEGLGTLFVVHVEPTNSHSKFIIADDHDDEFAVTLGSCNWLASGFNRFEASVSIQNTQIVVEMLTIASRLARGLSRVSNNLSRELAVLARNIKKTGMDISRPKASEVAGIGVQLVLKSQHHEFIRKARDEAAHQIFVCSHRISHFADRPIIAPLIASVGAPNAISAEIYYGALSGGMKSADAATLSERLAGQGIKIEKASRPMIHAKILTWDHDNAVITSLNWLSASTTGDNYDEIGIYLRGDDVATKVKESFINYVKA
ncbi:phospholipase D-like domain-containing protein [Pseudomonas syringae]|nr:phospholipase D-like domain-containing protein [Pseudomonas syringae]